MRLFPELTILKQLIGGLSALKGTALSLLMTVIMRALNRWKRLFLICRHLHMAGRELLFFEKWSIWERTPSKGIAMSLSLRRIRSITFYVMGKGVCPCSIFLIKWASRQN